jgi:DNA modification methylase
MTVRILNMDVFAGLATLDDDSVDIVITSPPYWGLRDYGVEGQMGLEATLAEHIEVLVRVFREVWRVLKPTGCVWLNYGDCYATKPNGRSAAKTKEAGTDDRTFRDKPFSTVGGGIKAKDLCMIPARLAIALCDDGWWVRSKVVWHKPNPMPESVRDRPATSYEEIFLLTKKARYFWNKEGAKEPAAPASVARWNQDVEKQKGSKRANGGRKSNGTMKAVGGPRASDFQGDRKRGVPPRHADATNSDRNGLNDVGRGYMRNMRNVWTIAPKPFKEAHFATFPPAIPEKCIKAACPDGGLVLDPFGGAGTTALVAHQMGRDAVLIELNPDYVDIADHRLLMAGCAARIERPRPVVDLQEMLK